LFLRRFNEAGVGEFKSYLATLRTDRTVQTKSLPAPMVMLEDLALTEIVTQQAECPDALFPNRLAAAKYLDGLLRPLCLPNVLDDVGLWAWLALRFFDQLRPLQDGLVTNASMGVEEARFIPTNHYTDQHRHLLRGPYKIYRVVDGDADRAMCFLVQPIFQPGDFIEQIASNKMISMRPELVATLSKLVVDPTSQSLYRNASSKARRLVAVLGQFDCTYDLGYVARDLLIPMLPDELKTFGPRPRRPLRQ